MRPFQIRGGGRGGGRTSKALFFPFAAPFLWTLYGRSVSLLSGCFLCKRAPKDRVHVALVLCRDRALLALGVPPVFPQIINFTGGNYFLPPPVLSRRLGGGGQGGGGGGVKPRTRAWGGGRKETETRRVGRQTFGFPPIPSSTPPLPLTSVDGTATKTRARENKSFGWKGGPG